MSQAAEQKAEPVVTHTPGPWKVGGYFNSTQGMPESLAVWHDSVVEGKVLPAICLVASIELMNATDEANARLIAAAPDLLAACQDLLTHASLTEHMSAFSVERARAAVAKATKADIAVPSTAMQL